MSGRWIDCPMCNHRYDGYEQAVCNHCPLGAVCTFACCPMCGYSTIHPERSNLVQQVIRWFARAKQADEIESPMPLSLRDIPDGRDVRVAAYSDGVTNRQMDQLHGYGVRPGQWVQVLQQGPVTIVQVDYSEIALEDDLARKIQVFMQKEPAHE